MSAGKGLVVVLPNPEDFGRQKAGKEGRCYECGKIAAPGDWLCPRHRLLRDEEKNEATRRHEANERKREYKDNQRSLLETSPLAADNTGGCIWTHNSHGHLSKCHAVRLAGCPYCPRHAALIAEQAKQRELEQQEKHNVTVYQQKRR